MNAGTAIAIVLGPLLYRWLATHEGFTLALVKLEAGFVFGLFIAIGFHIAGMVAGHEPSWAADERVADLFRSGLHRTLGVALSAPACRKALRRGRDRDTAARQAREKDADAL